MITAILFALISSATGFPQNPSEAPIITNAATECLPRWRGDTFDCVCNENHCDTIELPDEIAPFVFNVYTSSPTEGRLNLSYSEFNDNANTAYDVSVVVNTTTGTHEIIGFGGALTDATSYNVALLTPTVQEMFFDSYFGQNGSEYSFVRVPIGGTDFSTRFYTNADLRNTTDARPGLDGNMRLEDEDCNYKIPYIHKIQQRNNDIKILGGAWRAPQWMTYKDWLQRNSIKREHFKDWAEYHKRFFDLYKQYGINFWGTTTGNEVVAGVYSVAWTLEDHQHWIDEYLGPIMKNSEYADMKLLTLDDQTMYMIPWTKLMVDPKTSSFLDGMATHWYFDHNVVLLHEFFHSSFPDKILLNTEACFCESEKEGYEEKKQWLGAELYAENILLKLKYFMNGWLDWNLAVDEKGGPNVDNNFCTAPIVINAEQNEFYKGPTYYAMAHFSKFIPPGSMYLTGTIEPYDWLIKAGVFRVKDRPWDIVAVVLNRNLEEKRVRICVEDSCAFITAPARSIITAITNQQLSKLGEQ